MYIIAIDGTGGSGKGAIASHVADELGFFYLDSGIYYRAVAYLALKNNLDIKDEASIVKAARDMQISFVVNNVTLNGEDVTYKLRMPDVNDIVSPVSSIKGVRYIINDLIRNYALNKNIVIDGRDIASVVFPNADVKIYLDASAGVRAMRRFEQLTSAGVSVTYEEVLSSLIKRDKMDKEKEFGSLVLVDDAIYIDTSNKLVEESINEVLEIVRSEIK